MPDPGPFESPYHHVTLPGQAAHEAPPGYPGWVGPMPAAVEQGAAPTRPATLTAASWSWLAATALFVLGLPALLYTGADALADDILADSQATGDPLTRAEAEVGARFTPVLFGLGFAVLSTPFVVAALKLRSGREWARVLLAVLGAIGFVVGLFALFALPHAHSSAGLVWAL
ncbi:hypothetical protein K7G98_32970, partial [Saccharothrix sp. MB29]|nr:hypothetical protein [Saccharothrix sp. MB29]